MELSNWASPTPTSPRLGSYIGEGEETGSEEVRPVYEEPLRNWEVRPPGMEPEAEPEGLSVVPATDQRLGY